MLAQDFSHPHQHLTLALQQFALHQRVGEQRKDLVELVDRVAQRVVAHIPLTVALLQQQIETGAEPLAHIARVGQPFGNLRITVFLDQGAEACHHFGMHLPGKLAQGFAEQPGARLRLEQAGQFARRLQPVRGEFRIARRKYRRAQATPTLRKRPPASSKSTPHSRSRSQSRNCFTAAPRYTGPCCGAIMSISRFCMVSSQQRIARLEHM